MSTELLERFNIEQELNALGVPQHLLDNLECSNSEFAKLLHKLSIRITFNPKFTIASLWQLNFLIGNLKTINLFIYNYFKDSSRANIAHYAAWSGNPNTLQLVKDTYPNLLEQKDKYDNTIAHYAALSGCSKALE